MFLGTTSKTNDRRKLPKNISKQTQMKINEQTFHHENTSNKTVTGKIKF
jgi:hypothetical protein